MKNQDAIVAVYRSEAEAESAASDLKSAGLRVRQVQSNSEDQGLDGGVFDCYVSGVSGIPANPVFDYGNRLQGDRFCLVCDGSASEIQQAKNVLEMSASGVFDFRRAVHPNVRAR